MNIIIAANIISFIGSVLMILMGLVKRKRNVLILNCIQCGIMGAGNLMLGGVSGFLVDLVTIARNLVSFRTDFRLQYKIGFTAALAFLSIAFNRAGLIGWLPIAAASLMTWVLDTKDDRKIKIACFTGQIMWAVYDFAIMNYSACIFDVAAVISNAVGYLRINREMTKS